MNAAAGAVGIVGFALTTTKSIYQTVLSIRHAPDIVGRAARSLEEMTQVLEQIHSLDQCAQQNPDLVEIVQDYRDAIADARKKVHKVQSLPTDNRVKRFWRQVKTHLGETDLDRIHCIVQQQMARLSLHLNILTTRNGVINAESLSKLNDLADAQKEHTVMLVKLGDRVNRHLDGTETFVRRDQDLGRGVKNLQITTQKGFKGLLEKIEDSSQKASDLSNMSKDQHGELVSKLDMVAQMVHRLQLKEEATASLDLVHASSGSSVVVGGDLPMHADIDNAIRRLHAYLDGVEHSLYNEEAESLVKDLDSIIQLLVEKSTEYKPSSDVGPYLNRQDLENIRRKITSSSQAIVNGKANKWRQRLTKLYRRSSKLWNYSTPWGTLQLFILRGRLRSEEPNDQISEPQDRALHILNTRIQLPLANDEMAYITVSFMEQLYQEHSVRIGPTIVVSPILPLDAEVFSVVKQGDVDALRRLLAEGQATLSTRDQYGRCLLNYALNSRKPDLCKFLVDNGAEVDFIEAKAGGDFENKYISYGPSLNLISWASEFSEADELLDYCLCQQVLLEAGADPLLSTQHSSSAFECELLYGTARSLQQLLNSSSDFIDINQRFIEDRPQSESTLLFHLSLLNHRDSDTVEVLLKHGSHVDGRNMYGRSCLHLALEGSFRLQNSDLREAPSKLLRAGADVYAKDSQGITPSHIACNRNWLYRLGPPKVFKSEKNDDLQLRKIWAQALTMCGYDAEEVIRRSVDDEIARHSWYGGERSWIDEDGVPHDEEYPEEGFEEDFENDNLLSADG